MGMRERMIGCDALVRRGPGNYNPAVVNVYGFEMRRRWFVVSPPVAARI